MMNTVFNILHWLRAFLDAAELLPDLVSPRGIFCLIAWVSTLFAAGISLVSLFADFGDGDADVDGGGGGEVGVFSVRALIGFLLGFGWGGYVAVQGGLSVLSSVLIALLVGLVMFSVIAAMMRFIYSLKSDGSRDFSQKSMLGMTGTVYVTIPPAGETGGQVQVSREGSQLITMPAVQKGDSPLPPQTSIEVIEATPYLLTVRPLRDSSPS